MIIAWFALLFTGRYPQGMYDFVAGGAALPDARLRLRGPAQRPVPAVLGRSGDGLPRRPGHRAAEGGVQPPEGPLPPDPRDPGAHHPVRDADRGPGRRAPRLVRDRDPRSPAQGPAGHDRAGAELPAARDRLFALLTEDWPPFTDDTAGHTVEPAPAFGALAATPPAAGPESPTSVPPAATPRPSARRRSRPRRRRCPRRAAERRAASRRPPASPRPPPEPPDRPRRRPSRPRPSPARAARSDGRRPRDDRRRPARRRRPRRPRRRRPSRCGARAEPEPGPSRQATGPTPRRRRPATEPEPPPGRGRRADDEEDEPPPGPFGPSSTNP